VAFGGWRVGPWVGCGLLGSRRPLPCFFGRASLAYINTAWHSSTFPGGRHGETESGTNDAASVAELICALPLLCLRVVLASSGLPLLASLLLPLLYSVRDHSLLYSGICPGHSQLEACGDELGWSGGGWVGWVVGCFAPFLCCGGCWLGWWLGGWVVLWLFGLLPVWVRFCSGWRLLLTLSLGTF